MDILFVTSSTALASAITNTLISAGHTVVAISTVNDLRPAWDELDHVDVIVIDDMTQPPLLAALHALLEEKAHEYDTNVTTPQVLLLSTPSRTSTGNLDRTPAVKRRTPIPTIRRSLATRTQATAMGTAATKKVQETVEETTKNAAGAPATAAVTMPTAATTTSAAPTVASAPATASTPTATSTSTATSTPTIAPTATDTPNTTDAPISTPVLPHADAVIVKPFSDAELLSHIRALAVHANSSQTDKPRMLIHGDLMLDTLHQQAFYRGSTQPLALSTREYLALETLIRANGEFLTFDELLAKVCGTGFFEQRDVMNGVVYSLTRKLRRLGFFITQHGNKYRIR